MEEKTASYRRILKSSSIIGGSSVITILIGLVRVKVLAVLAGPAGVGLVSLYTGLMTTGSTVASMGIGTAGTRQIAEAAADDDMAALATARRALFWLALLLACAGAVVVWVFRDLLALLVLGSSDSADVVGWLALGVALSVAGASQAALLQGMRRINDMARVSIYGAVINTVVGTVILWRFGTTALVAWVLVGPAATLLLGHVYVSRLPRLDRAAADWKGMGRQWKMLLRVGLAFMVAGLAGTLVQLWIRVEIQGSLGVNALGQYQAAWTVSAQYLGFILGAMAADYYPRLTGVIRNKSAAVTLVNEQTEIALLLATPVIAAMIGLAPWAIDLLYSPAFAPAAGVLRWQMLADVFKVASWPMGFIIVADGDGRTFMLVETAFLLLLGVLISVFASSVGLQITGIATLVCYIAYVPVMYFIARRKIGFAWNRQVALLLAVAIALCAGVATLSAAFSWGVYVAVVVSFLYGFYAIGRVSHASGLTGTLGRIGGFAYDVCSRLGLHRD